MNWTITISLVIVVSLSLIPVRLVTATVFDSSGEAVGGESPFFRNQPPAQITPPDNFLQPPMSSAPSDGGATVADPGVQQQPQQQPEQEEETRNEDGDDEEEENGDDDDNNVVFNLNDSAQKVCAGFNQLSNEDKLRVIFTLGPDDKQLLFSKLSTCPIIRLD